MRIQLSKAGDVVKAIFGASGKMFGKFASRRRGMAQWRRRQD
jgi:hypothetical protein